MTKLRHAGRRRGARCFARGGWGMEMLEPRTFLAATWTPLAHAAPGSITTMMLLPDGSVMAPSDGDNAGNDWARLVPDASGSYINGTWTRLARAHDTRLFDASQVLQDGRLFVAGGEYGTGAATGETYNPITNAWTALPAQSFGSFLDSGSMLLPNGTVMVAPVSPNPGGFTTIFNPATNTWSQGPKSFRGGSTDEQSFVKLADDSILTIDGNTTSERFIPAQNKWVNDAAVPVAMFDGLGEIGPGLRLADGRAFFLGATGHSAIYTPSGSAAAGSWAAGPDIPAGLGTDDAPAAVLPDGTILLVAGPTGTYNGPTTFYLYDPIANAFSTVAAAPTVGGAPFLSRMLDLPDGTVLFTSGGTGLYVYNPNVTPLPAAKPAISSLAPNADGTVLLTGTGLNGISAGAAYGDDAQMDSNYPIVRLTSGSSVYYARTSGWSSTGVATGLTPETTNFTLPLGIPAGSYSVVLVANGIASDPASLTISMTGGNVAPTVATAAAATPSPTSGATTALSVLGADDNAESNLTYTWSTTAVPSTAPLPSFSVNGSNAAKNTTVTFARAGSYTFNVVITDVGGLSTSTTVTVIVVQTRSSIALSPTSASLTSGGSQQFTASALDQFGVAMTSQPAFTWSVLSGGGSISAAGKYTAPATGTLATIQVTDGTLQTTAQIGVVTAPWVSADIGGPTLKGSAYDTAGTFTLTGSGADIYGTLDEFRFVYRTITGDGSVTAHVVTQQNTNVWAKGGVMIRNSLSSSDMMAFMSMTPGNGANFQYRTVSGGSAAAAASIPGLTAPYWVRIVRAGTTLTGYRSSNGSTWIASGSATIAMGNTIYVGLEDCSHTNSALSTVTYDNVGISQATVATGAQAAPATVTALSTALSVLGADPAGESNLTYTWAATSVPIGGVVAYGGNTNGTNAGKNITASFNKAGSYQFTVTISDGVVSSTSTVSVTVNQTLTSITVTPAPGAIQPLSTRQFTATALDQFNNPMSVQPSFTWSVTSGTGNTITTGGLLTAGTLAGTYTVNATGGGMSGGSSATIPPTVLGRYIYYNNSYWNDSSFGRTDDMAIDPSKTALLPGQTATFANYTSSLQGINGVMIDLTNLSPGATLSAADFSFAVGNDSSPAGWPAAPVLPAITLHRGKGTGGSDRIELTWPDNTIQQQWLQITVNANGNPNTGLSTPDVFYFGNAIGETGNSPGDTFVDASDMVAVRDNITPSGSHEAASSRFDLNKDGFADASDMVVVRDHVTDPSNRLRLINPVLTPAAAPGSTTTRSTVISPVAASSVPAIASPPRSSAPRLSAHASPAPAPTIFSRQLIRPSIGMGSTTLPLATDFDELRKAK